jgi:hypothetical protein
LIDAALQAQDLGGAGPHRVGDEGAVALLGLQQPDFLQLLVDLAHGHGRDAQLAGHGAHRRQALARLELAADDPVFDHAAQLDAERDGKAGIDIEGHERGTAPKECYSRL